MPTSLKNDFGWRSFAAVAVPVVCVLLVFAILSRFPAAVVWISQAVDSELVNSNAPPSDVKTAGNAIRQEKARR